MQRISKQHLTDQLDRLNRLTGNPLTKYTRGDGAWRGNVGHYCLYSAYGMTGLHQLVNEGGGAREVFGLTTKRDLYGKLDALILGYSLALEAAQ